jgi:hypothetical protein
VAGAVVDCGPRLADDSLWLDSDGSAIRVGDAIAARTVAEAIREGRNAALALDPTALSDAIGP